MAIFHVKTMSTDNGERYFVTAKTTMGECVVVTSHEEILAEMVAARLNDTVVDALAEMQISHMLAER